MFRLRLGALFLVLAVSLQDACSVMIMNGLVYGNGETVGRTWITPAEKAEILKSLDDADASLQSSVGTVHGPGMPAGAAAAAESALQNGRSSVAKSRADIEKFEVRSGPPALRKL